MRQMGPKPWTVRRSTRDDAAAMAALFNERCNYLGREGHDTEEALQWHWDQPTHEHLQTDCLVLDASGGVIAWAGITEAPEPYLKLLFGLVPHPRLHDCAEFWDLLCSEVQSYARAFARLAPERSRTILRTFALLGDSPKRESLVRNGFDLARVQNKMRIDLASPPPSPVWPDGIRLTPFSFERDLAAVVAAYQEAFRDHWGSSNFPTRAKWRNGEKSIVGRKRVRRDALVHSHGW